ncbi:MAG: hypothetical protein Q9213_000721 [Squamulea squamosa]
MLRSAFLVWSVIAFFGQYTNCSPSSLSIGSSSSLKSAPEYNDSSPDNPIHEFSGLNLRYQHRRIQSNVFTIESMAIAAIHAMKETALEDYNSPLVHFDFIDALPPQNPIRILMMAAPGASAIRLKRSSVLWSLKSLTIELLTSGLLYPMTFKVRYWLDDLYLGVLTGPPEGTTGIDQSISHPSSSAVKSIPDTSSGMIRATSSLNDNTHYEVNFDFVGQDLSQVRIFESILTLLLQLAKHDHLATLHQISMEMRDKQAWIYIQEVSLPPPSYHFQQYHAVALLEAVARYYVHHGRYTEMTFELMMDGYLMAWGCVTYAVSSRRWCAQMFPDGRTGTNGMQATS